MKNPLTLEERANVPLLIRHDTGEAIFQLTEMAYGHRDNSRAYEKSNHVMETLNSITILSTYSEDCYFDRTRGVDIRLVNNHLISLFKKGTVTASSTIRDDDGFLSHRPLLYTALYNLTKNGVRIAGKEGKVDVSVTESMGVHPRGLVYSSPEGKLKGCFVT